MPSQTPNLLLYQPDPGQSGVAGDLNANLDTLDNAFDAATGHTHTGGAGDGPKIPTGSIDATGTADATTFLRGDGTWASGGGGSGVTDHGDLTGLADDDHTQYYNQARGDARYLRQSSNLGDVASAAAARGNIGAEAALGNPSTDGYVLSSTAAGSRSWVAPGSGTVTIASGDARYARLASPNTLTDDQTLQAPNPGTLHDSFDSPQLGVVSSQHAVGTTSYEGFYLWAKRMSETPGDYEFRIASETQTVLGIEPTGVLKLVAPPSNPSTTPAAGTTWLWVDPSTKALKYKTDAGTTYTLDIGQTAGDARWLQSSNNLSDLASASTARTNLGLGTAATKNIPATGNASSTEVVYGSDTRLSDARTPTAHTHAAADVTSGVLAIGRLATGTPDGTKFVRDDGTLAVPAGGGGGGSGTVTSVALTVPADLSVSGSPVTTSGTLAITRATQSANQVLAGPTSGGAATPGYRALVAADIPAIAESGVTSLTTDLAAKAPLASPALTGTPTAPTAAAATNSTQIATTAYADAAATAATGALTKISETLLGSGAASITFSSIPGTYRHLLIKIAGRSDAVATFAWIQLRFNSDTGANYNSGLWQLFGTGTTASTTEELAQTVGYAGMAAAANSPSNQAGAGEIQIFDYARTQWAKSYTALTHTRMSTSSGDTRTEGATGTWNSTAAITSVTLLPSSGNWATGTIVQLYGVS